MGASRLDGVTVLWRACLFIVLFRCRVGSVLWCCIQGALAAYTALVDSLAVSSVYTQLP